MIIVFSFSIVLFGEGIGLFLLSTRSNPEESPSRSKVVIIGKPFLFKYVREAQAVSPIWRRLRLPLIRFFAK